MVVIQELKCCEQKSFHCVCPPQNSFIELHKAEKVSTRPFPPRWRYRSQSNEDVINLQTAPPRGARQDGAEATCAYEASITPGSLPLRPSRGALEEA